MPPMEAVNQTGTSWLPTGLTQSLKDSIFQGQPMLSTANVASNIWSRTGATQETATPGYLPWPPNQPTVNVPYFDLLSYRMVDLDVQPSCLPSGLDLPLNDVTTLRFFFNLGVNHARAILLSFHVQGALSGIASQAPPSTSYALSSTQPTVATKSGMQIEQQKQLLNQIRAQQLLSSQQRSTNFERLCESDAQVIGTVRPQIEPNVVANTISQNEGSTSGAALEALQLQNALLAASASKTNISLAELEQLRYYLTIGASNSQNIVPQRSNSAFISAQHRLQDVLPIPVAINGADMEGNVHSTRCAATSPRIPIPVDPAPHIEPEIDHSIPNTSKDFQNSVTIQQLSDLLLRNQVAQTSSALQAAQLAAAVAATQHSCEPAKTTTAKQQVSAFMTSTPSSLSITSSKAQTDPPNVLQMSQQTVSSSEEVPLSRSILADAEKHYNEAFNTAVDSEKAEASDAIRESTLKLADISSGGKVESSKSRLVCFSPSSSLVDSLNAYHQLHPHDMINLLNCYVSRAKNELHHQGLGVSLDATGRSIDFSARPVDPIFREARERLESNRDCRDPGLVGGQLIPPIDSNQCKNYVIREEEVVRLASERASGRTAPPNSSSPPQCKENQTLKSKSTAKLNDESKQQSVSTTATSSTSEILSQTTDSCENSSPELPLSSVKSLSLSEKNNEKFSTTNNELNSPPSEKRPRITSNETD